MEDSGRVFKIDLPYFITLGKKRYSCNLNQYRNAHYRVTNAMKREFKELIREAVEELPKLQKVKLYYKIFYENNRLFDIDNIVSVVSKFTQDALVELGALPEDNYKHIVKITGVFGGVDRENPRIELWIKEINE